MIDFLAHNAGLIGLLVFFCFFVAVFAATWRPSKKAELQALALIPLQENENE